MFGQTNHGWIGLDIGASSIKLAQVVRKGDRLHLQEAAIVPRQSPWDDDDLIHAPPVSAAAEIETALVSAPQVAGTRTAALLPTTACEFNTAPFVEAGGSGQISAIVDELETVGATLAGRVFDYWPGLAAKSGQGGVNVLSTSRAWSETTTADIGLSGLSCHAIDGLPHALTRAVNLVHSSTSGTVAALDWGYSGTTFVLIDQAQPVYVRQLKHSGLAEALETVAERLNLDGSEASELIRSVNLAPNQAEADDEVSQVVGELLEPSVTVMVTEMQRTLEHIHNIGKNMTPKRLFLAPQQVYLFGGGATLGGVDLLLSHRLHRQVRTWALGNDDQAVATAKATPMCLLGPAIALSMLKWEDHE